MKIAIASDDGKSISAQFEKTTGFIMVVVDKNRSVCQKEFIASSSIIPPRISISQNRNSALESKDIIASSLDNCDVVISRGIGFNAYTDLVNSEIEVYLTRENVAEQAVDLYLREELDHNPELRRNQ